MIFLLSIMVVLVLGCQWQLPGVSAAATQRVYDEQSCTGEMFVLSPGGESGEKHCYRFYPESMGFTNAAMKCISDGGVLPTAPEDDNEVADAFLKALNGRA